MRNHIKFHITLLNCLKKREKSKYKEKKKTTTAGLTYPGTLPENSKKPTGWKFENIKSRKEITRKNSNFTDVITVLWSTQCSYSNSSTTNTAEYHIIFDIHYLTNKQQLKLSEACCHAWTLHQYSFKFHNDNGTSIPGFKRSLERCWWL